MPQETQDLPNYDEENLKAFDLTDWVNKPTLTELKEDYDAGQTAYKEQVTRLDKWAELHNPPKMERKDLQSTVTPKSIKKAFEWGVSSILNNLLETADMYSAKPLGANDTALSMQEVKILNSQMNGLKKVQFMEKFTRTVLSEGSAFIKIQWLYEDEDDGQGGVNIIKNQPDLQVVSSRQILLDPYATSFEDIDYLVETYETSISSLTKKGFYKNLDKLKARVKEGYVEDSVSKTNPTAVTETPTTESNNQVVRKKIEVKEYWGYYDIYDTNELVLIKASWALDTLIELKVVAMDSPPYELCNYNIDLDMILGHPDAEALEDNQKVIGAITRGVLNILARSSNGQIGLAEDFLSDSEILNFNAGKPYKFNPSIPPERGLYMHKYEDIPDSALVILQQQYQEMESTTGIKIYGSGANASSFGDTATGVNTVTAGLGKREGNVLNRFGECLNTVGKRIIRLNSLLLSPQEKSEYTDAQPIPYPKNDAMLMKSINLTLNSSETEALKGNQLMTLSQTVAPTMPPELQKMLVANILKLYNLPDMAKQLEEQDNAPDPIQQQMQEMAVNKSMLDLELLKAQISNETAKAQENAVDVELKKAKTQVELARAKDTSIGASAKGNELLNELSGANAYNKGLEMDLKQKQKEKKTNE